jgi:hypothetical protein
MECRWRNAAAKQNLIFYVSKKKFAPQSRSSFVLGLGFKSGCKFFQTPKNFGHKHNND